MNNFIWLHCIGGKIQLKIGYVKLQILLLNIM
jgi:hypothetical protein